MTRACIGRLVPGVALLTVSLLAVAPQAPASALVPSATQAAATSAMAAPVAPLGVKPKKGEAYAEALGSLSLLWEHDTEWVGGVIKYGDGLVDAAVPLMASADPNDQQILAIHLSGAALSIDMITRYRTKIFPSQLPLVRKWGAKCESYVESAADRDFIAREFTLLRGVFRALSTGDLASWAQSRSLVESYRQSADQAFAQRLRNLTTFGG
jgi:hypothetical protein